MQKNRREFDPSKFVKTAEETWKDRLEFMRFIKENEHAAVKFHVKGLESIVPPQYPGEVAVHLARSHHGKSTALRDETFQVQQSIEGKDGVLVGLVSLEDTSETTAGKQVRKYGGESLAYEDDQFVFIGNSFNMSLEDMSDLHMGNIIKTLDYARKNKFASEMQYAYIGIDFAQLIPRDPERAMMVNMDEMRLQAFDDTRRICAAAKYFKCPIGFAAQANMKDRRTNHTSKMMIPGAADIQESAAYYQLPDIVYSYWQPKHDHPIGSVVEDGNWKFTVTNNLCFVKVLKRRNAEDLGAIGKRDVVGRVFPCFIQEDGSYAYDKSEHEKMLQLKPME